MVKIFIYVAYFADVKQHCEKPVGKKLAAKIDRALKKHPRVQASQYSTARRVKAMGDECRKELIEYFSGPGAVHWQSNYVLTAFR